MERESTKWNEQLAKENHRQNYQFGRQREKDIYIDKYIYCTIQKDGQHGVKIGRDNSKAKALRERDTMRVKYSKIKRERWIRRERRDSNKKAKEEL